MRVPKRDPLVDVTFENGRVCRVTVGACAATMIIVIVLSAIAAFKSPEAASNVVRAIAASIPQSLKSR
jgi:hypothetical protein